MRRLLIVGVLLCGSIGTFGCAHFGGTGQPWQFVTHRHFLRSSEIRTALVRGDLERARRAGAAIVEHESPAELPQRASALLANTRDRARDLATAESIAEAASAAMRMAVTCGACHSEGRVGPRYVLGPGARPPTEPGHSAKYSWSVARLWQGLVAPSDSAWTEGVTALTTIPMDPNELVALGIEASWVEGPLRELASLVQAGPRSEGAQARAAFASEVIVSCAGCHTAFP